MSAFAVYRFMQPTEIPGVSLRMFDVQGDHRLAKSTVAIDILIEEGIPIDGLTPAEVKEEYTKVKRYLEGETNV